MFHPMKYILYDSVTKDNNISQSRAVIPNTGREACPLYYSCPAGSLQHPCGIHGNRSTSFISSQPKITLTWHKKNFLDLSSDVDFSTSIEQWKNFCDL